MRTIYVNHKPTRRTRWLTSAGRSAVAAAAVALAGLGAYAITRGLQ